jgi:tetratricopeptide (TPR) repeat protein
MHIGYFYDNKDIKKAIIAYQEAIKLSTESIKKHPDIDTYNGFLAFNLNNIGFLHQQQNDYLNAEKEYEKSINIYETLTTNYPDNDILNFNLAIIFGCLGMVYQKQENKFQEAVEAYKKTLDIFKKLIEKYPNNDEYKSLLASTLFKLGFLYHLNDKEKLPKAEQTFKEAIDIYKKLIEKDSMNNEYKYKLVSLLNHIGLLYKSQNKLSEAEQVFKRAIDIDNIFLKKYNKDDSYKHYMALALRSMGDFCNPTKEKKTIKQSYYIKALDILKPLKEKGTGEYDVIIKDIEKSLQELDNIN